MNEHISTMYGYVVKYTYITNPNEEYLREDGWLT